MNEISNINEYTVSELNNSIKKTIESNFSYIKLIGEVSKIIRHTSGHIYITLKDENESISAVCWRSKVSKLSLIPGEGEKILIYGKVTTYSLQSKYQITIDKIESEGEGSLLKKFEEIKLRLEKEGIFDQKYKKKIPFLPDKVGVITSENGAVIKDIIHRISDRFPLEIIIYPVSVQGKGCVQQISEIIQKINIESLKGNKDFIVDVLILARGGGSLEDLMPFNEEVLVKAIFNSIIPIISAIGHETDFTLSDFASDLRAPTPTAAAEFVVPVKKELNIKNYELMQRLNKAISRLMENKNLNTQNLYNQIPDVKTLINQKFQSLDFIEVKLINLIINFLKESKIRLKDIIVNLDTKVFFNELSFFKERKKNLDQRLQKSLNNTMIFLDQKIKENSKLLSSLSYKNILKRGYSVTRVSGKLVNRDKEILKGQTMEIEYYDSRTIVKKL
ncbi:exodeoxyribonuclease VII large subunit [Rickettsiales bacterium]|nr:exodeoxyribonuclease VII large subunit [Rickettsiales bacterium]